MAALGDLAQREVAAQQPAGAGIEPAGDDREPRRAHPLGAGQHEAFPGGDEVVGGSPLDGAGTSPRGPRPESAATTTAPRRQQA